MLLVDAGPLVAAAASRDRNHARCVALLTSEPDPLVVPALVLTEVAYLLGERIGPHAEVAFARSIAQVEFVVEPPHPSDWSRIAELTATYVDLPLGIVDASDRRRRADRDDADCDTRPPPLHRRPTSARRVVHSAALTLLGAAPRTGPGPVGHAHVRCERSPSTVSAGSDGEPGPVAHDLDGVHNRRG